MHVSYTTRLHVYQKNKYNRCAGYVCLGRYSLRFLLVVVLDSISLTKVETSFPLYPYLIGFVVCSNKCPLPSQLVTSTHTRSLVPGFETHGFVFFMQFCMAVLGLHACSFAWVFLCARDAGTFSFLHFRVRALAFSCARKV
jgi:hypothetical protein